MRRHAIVFAFLAILCLPAALRAQADFEIDGSVGRLRVVLSRPVCQQPNDSCPLVIIMHGFTGNKNESLLTNISDSLLSRGIGTIRFDFNGHGQSEGKFLDMNIRNEVEDAKAIYRFASRLPWVTRIGLVGHSQGGVIATITAGELPEDAVSSLVLLAPAANITEGARQGIILGTHYAPDSVPETLNVWGRPLRRHYFDIARTIDIHAIAALYSGPALVLHGAADHTVPADVGRRLAASIPHSTLQVVDGDDHGLSRQRVQNVRAVTDFLVKSLLK